MQRQAERVARGQKPKGRNPKTDVKAHVAQINRLEYLTDGLCYLLAERGIHAGSSPLQRSGMAAHEEADWLTILGYPPVSD